LSLHRRGKRKSQNAKQMTLAIDAAVLRFLGLRFEFG